MREEGDKKVGMGCKGGDVDGVSVQFRIIVLYKQCAGNGKGLVSGIWMGYPNLTD